MLQDTARAHEADELQMCRMNLQSGLAQVNAVRRGGSQSRVESRVVGVAEWDTSGM